MCWMIWVWALPLVLHSRDSLCLCLSPSKAHVLLSGQRTTQTLIQQILCKTYIRLPLVRKNKLYPDNFYTLFWQLADTHIDFWTPRIVLFFHWLEQIHLSSVISVNKHRNLYAGRPSLCKRGESVRRTNKGRRGNESKREENKGGRCRQMKLRAMQVPRCITEQAWKARIAIRHQSS